jgi:hypothetical protein
MSVRRTILSALAVVVLALPGPVSAASPPAQGIHHATSYKNCDALNRVYPHGVGRKGARDIVRGKTRPVTNFTVNTAVYNANKARDRDKDGIACEKR